MKSSRSGSALNVLVLSFAVAVSYATSECASTPTSRFRLPTFSTGSTSSNDPTGSTGPLDTPRATQAPGADGARGPRSFVVGRGQRARRVFLSLSPARGWRLRETRGGGRA